MRMRVRSGGIGREIEVRSWRGATVTSAPRGLMGVTRGT